MFVIVSHKQRKKGVMQIVKLESWLQCYSLKTLIYNVIFVCFLGPNSHPCEKTSGPF